MAKQNPKTHKRKDISTKTLYILKLLLTKEYTKQELIEEFLKINIKLSKSSITNYLKKLKEHNIPLKISKTRNQNLYSMDKDRINIKYLDFELDILSQIKDILMNTKDKTKLRALLRVFYKLAYLTKDETSRLSLCNFGYYSKINWKIVRELEYHAKQKNKIEILYNSQNKREEKLFVHCDFIKIGDWSNRLYLACVIEGYSQLSYLRVDKILSVLKIKEENIPIKLKKDILIYKTTKNAYQNLEFDEKETSIPSKSSMIKVIYDTKDYFRAAQRLLYLAPDLYYINHKELKNIIEEKLLCLWRMYEK